MHGVRTAPYQYSRRQLSILREETTPDTTPSATEWASPRNHLRATFDLLIQALPNKTITKRLGLSEATVRSYISEIFAALGYTNRGELTITAIKAGY